MDLTTKRVPYLICRGAKVIYLVRHAAGRHNETKDYDNPKFVDAILTAKGKEQAIALRNNPDLKDPDFVIASPLSRAFNTASLAFPDSKIVIDPLCREKRSFKCDLLRHEFENTPDLLTETETELIIRAKLFVEKLRELEFPKVIVVTHGAFMNAITSVLAGKDHLYKTKYFTNTEILKINLED